MDISYPVSLFCFSEKYGLLTVFSEGRKRSLFFTEIPRQGDITNDIMDKNIRKAGERYNDQA